jgi:hypothetical protein
MMYKCIVEGSGMEVKRKKATGSKEEETQESAIT